MISSTSALLRAVCQFPRLSLRVLSTKRPVPTAPVDSEETPTAQVASEENGEVDPLNAAAILEKSVQRQPYNLEAFKKLKFDQYPYYVEREWWKEGKRMTFWSTWRMLRDVKRRRLLEQLGPDRMRLKALKENTVLPQAIRDESAETLHNFPKASCPNLILNMCQFTGRQRGKIKRWRVNRHIFRRLADHGQLSGVQRAMW